MQQNQRGTHVSAPAVRVISARFSARRARYQRTCQPPPCAPSTGARLGWDGPQADGRVGKRQPVQPGERVTLCRTLCSKGGHEGRHRGEQPRAMRRVVNGLHAVRSRLDQRLEAQQRCGLCLGGAQAAEAHVQQLLKGRLAKRRLQGCAQQQQQQQQQRPGEPGGWCINEGARGSSRRRST